MNPLLQNNSRSSAEEKTPRQTAVIRLGSLSRDPETAVERLVVLALKANGAMTFRSVVERVASELYNEELRHGAWVLDIGLFGSNLFVPEVMNEIEGGDGTLWHIESSRDNQP